MARLSKKSSQIALPSPPRRLDSRRSLPWDRARPLCSLVKSPDSTPIIVGGAGIFASVLCQKSAVPMQRGPRVAITPLIDIDYDDATAAIGTLASQSQGKSAVGHSPRIDRWAWRRRLALIHLGKQRISQGQGSMAARRRATKMTEGNHDDLRHCDKRIRRKLTW
jgi:hypothetical protein